MATLAPALVTLRTQINERFPTRSKASDGWIGDAAHAARLSQHNPNAAGVVCAIDVTEDLSVGLNCNLLMDQLDASNDPRIFYLIHDGYIDNSDDSRTKYTGVNQHVKHMHISTWWDKPEVYNDARPWNVPLLGGAPAPVSPPPVVAPRGSTLPDCQIRPLSFQRWYNAFPFKPALLPVIKPTADVWGPQSEAALKKVQARYGLVADGICGPKTKTLLWDLGWRG